MTTLRRMIGFAALTLMLGACAGGPEGEASAPGLDIRVLNGFVPTTALTVYVIDAAGRDLLGTVVPSGERTFRYHPSNMDATGFRLAAETGTGREITSPPFDVAPDIDLVWDVEANTVDRR